MSSLLLRNARVGLRGPIRNVLIRDGVVAAVTTEEPPAGESADVQGGTLLPGLWDAHVHMTQWAQTRRRVDLSGARSAREAAGLVAAHSGFTVGYGFRDGLWPDTPDKALLDAAAPGREVALFSNDLHTAWLSSAALAAVGVPGHPTGVLRERECFAAMAALPSPPERELDRWVAEATTAAAARGVVGVLDFEFADNVTDWSRRVREQRVDVRVACSIPKDRLEEAVGRGLRTGDPVAGSGGLLEVGPVKMFVDGSLNTRTAYCDDPYPGTEARGLLETPPDELRATMELAFEHGVRPAVHAIGDQATGIALDAFEQVGCPGRIEHAQLVRSADFARFARAGLVAGVQPAHAPDDRDVAERCPVARGARRRRPGAAPCPAGRTGRSDDHRDRPLGCHPGRAAGHGGGRHAARRPVDVSATRVSPAVSSAMPSPDPFAQGA